MRLVWLVPAAMPGWASPCSGPLSVCDMSRQPVLFVGEVIEGGLPPIDKDPRRYPAARVRFRVIENLRGLTSDATTVEVRLENWSTVPPAVYSLGKRYLVSPNHFPEGFVESPCVHGRELPRDNAFLDELRQQLRQPDRHITGRVAASSRDSRITDNLIDVGQLPPLAGVIITAARGGKTFHAATAVDGRYQLAVPGDGRYELRAGFLPALAPPVTVEVTGGCAHHSFALPVDNSIAGRIVDAKGQPAQAQVVLEDLDRPGVSVREDSFRQVSSGEFQIRDIPAGRYRLVTNPTGPLSNAPYARSVHPGDPLVLTAKGTHRKDLQLAVGRTVPFRDLTVRVLLRDGSLVRHVQVTCTAVTADPKLDWKTSHVPFSPEPGIFRIPVPADRPIRIEITDYYRRALKHPLTATVEPDTSAVQREFVLEP